MQIPRGLENDPVWIKYYEAFEIHLKWKEKMVELEKLEKGLVR